MNETPQEEAKRMAEVMLAFSRTEKIEVARRGFEEWTSCYNPTWSWAEFNYRVAPKPLEAWVNVYDDSPYSAYASKSEALANVCAGGRTVHMREVEE